MASSKSASSESAGSRTVGDRVYTQEEVQQILNLAIASHQESAQHGYQGEFSRSQLLEIASDLAIPASVVQQAERNWMQLRDERLQHEAFNQHRRTDLKHKLVRYGIVNTGLIAFNTFVGLSILWPLYLLILMGWTVALGLNAWTVFYQEGEAYENAFQSWYRKRQVRKVVSHWLGRWLGA